MARILNALRLTDGTDATGGAYGCLRLAIEIGPLDFENSRIYLLIDFSFHAYQVLLVGFLDTAYLCTILIYPLR